MGFEFVFSYQIEQSIQRFTVLFRRSLDRLDHALHVFLGIKVLGLSNLCQQFSAEVLLFAYLAILRSIQDHRQVLLSPLSQEVLLYFSSLNSNQMHAELRLLKAESKVAAYLEVLFIGFRCWQDLLDDLRLVQVVHGGHQKILDHIARRLHLDALNGVFDCHLIPNQRRNEAGRLFRWCVVAYLDQGSESLLLSIPDRSV